MMTMVILIVGLHIMRRHVFALVNFQTLEHIDFNVDSLNF